MFGKHPGKLGATGGRTPIQRAIAILRRLGNNANVYLPGVGRLNGLTAGNYLDSAGTTLGAVDQPVGLALSAAGALGVELVTNTLLTSWVASVPVEFSTLENNTTTFVDQDVNGARIRSTDGTNVQMSFGTSLTVGKTYKIDIGIHSVSAGAVQLAWSGTNFGAASSAVGTFSQIVVCAASFLDLKRQSGVSDFVIRSVSVREVTGIHASQATAANRPILRRGALNLLTYSQDFTNAAWGKTNTTVSGSTATAGGVTGALYQVYAVTPGSVYTFAILAKRGTMTDAKTSVYNVTGTADIQAPNSYFAEINSAISSIVARTFTVPAGCTSIQAYPLRDSGVTGTTILEAAALFAGTLTAAQIQALGGIPLTTTAPASTALGPYSWDTSGGKSFSATFPTGNESVTVIDARPTGQVTATAQNVVGSYNAAVALGVELVTNGTFNTDVTGWNAGTSTTASWDASGKLRADKNLTGWGGVGFPSMTLIAGKSYIASVLIDSTNLGGSSSCVSYNGANGNLITNAVGLSSMSFVATSGAPIISLQTNATTGYVLADNASVREVNPISGKIIVSGALTAPDLLLLQNFANKVAGL